MSSTKDRATSASRVSTRPASSATADELGAVASPIEARPVSRTARRASTSLGMISVSIVCARRSRSGTGRPVCRAAEMSIGAGVAGDAFHDSICSLAAALPDLPEDVADTIPILDPCSTPTGEEKVFPMVAPAPQPGFLLKLSIHPYVL